MDDDVSIVSAVVDPNHPAVTQMMMTAVGTIDPDAPNALQQAFLNSMIVTIAFAELSGIVDRGEFDTVVNQVYPIGSAFAEEIEQLQS